MAVSFRSHSRGIGCKVKTVDLDPNGHITLSVGAGGANARRDVRTVQFLLNGIGPLEGGPFEMLAVDGIVGPITLGAIHRFQSAQLGFTDGRVDVDGPTIKRLREPSSATPLFDLRCGPSPGLREALAKNLATPPADAHKSSSPKRVGGAAKVTSYVDRIQIAMWEWPDAKQAVDLILQRLSFAVPFAHPFGPNATAGGPLLDYFNKHFKIGTTRSDELVAKLRQIEHIYRLMKVVMVERSSTFGGTPWGTAIFAIDRFPNLNKDADAYTASGGMHYGYKQWVPDYSLPLKGDTIYLCDSFGRNSDCDTGTILHELAHLVGPEDTKSNRKGPLDGQPIVDPSYGFWTSYKDLNWISRMHCADTFALCAFESKFGTRRLLNSGQVVDEKYWLTAPVVSDGRILD